MHALRLLFSSSGRLPPRTFVFAAVVVYLVGAASELLTRPEVTARSGLWPFAAAQVLLIWIWFALHAKRLRDGGRPIGLAFGASLLYAFATLLLIVLTLSFHDSSAGQGPDANSASALGLILLVSIIAFLLGSPHYDLVWLLVAILLLAAFVPLIFAVAVTLWAATRPSGDSA